MFLKRFSLRAASLTLGLLLLIPSTSAILLHADDEIVLDEYLTEDVYLAGGNVTINQDIEGDLTIAGANVTVNGIIRGDLNVAGGNVIVNGEIIDDLRMVGGALSLNSNVGGDLVILGGDVDINKDVVVNGDLSTLAGVINLYGTVNRSVSGVLGRLVIGGRVNGNVDVRITEDIVVLRDGVIAGNLTYFAPNQVADQGGIIEGERTFNEIVSSSEKVKEELRSFINRGSIMGKFWSLISLLLIGFFMMMLFPNFFHHTSAKLTQSPFHSLGMGFLVFVLGGMASVIAAFTVVGLQLSFILMALLFILGELGRIATAYWIGNLIIKKDQPKKGDSKLRAFARHFGVLTLGLVIVKAIALIPFIGWIAGFFFLLMGSGAFFLNARHVYGRMVKEKLA